MTLRSSLIRPDCAKYAEFLGSPYCLFSSPNKITKPDKGSARESYPAYVVIHGAGARNRPEPEKPKTEEDNF
jgi:hypothetical protein